MKHNKFLAPLKLQLFAANDDEDEIDIPEISEQEEDEINVDDEELEEESENDDSEDEEETEEVTENIDDEADEQDDETTEEKPFMVFKNKDEHQKYMDNVIGERLKKQREKQEESESLLEIFKQYFDVDDIEDLKKKADELLDDVAYKKGTTKEQLKKQQQERSELKQFKAMQEEQQKQQAEQNLLNALTNDCAKLAKSNPLIYSDLKPEQLLNDKAFMQMLFNGIPFKQAYDAMHVEEILKKQTSKAKKNVIDDVKAKGTRISENATKQSKAASIKIDISKMTDEQLAELEQRAAMGEKIRF